MTSPAEKRPNCFRCAYFYITHEPLHPYGCKAMGFKGRQLPAITVRVSSGLNCQIFSPVNLEKLDDP
ncbi:MAG: uracil-DNA glycosylase [Proteobacteria bacterium]|nr:uracil-DNA glycosylase [Pseudomonadota bacterium]MBU1686097.1 uracil-DNA glycosylase [Pseudomonadota bacterium]